MDAGKPDGSAPPAPREHVPFIPASTVLPELTLKALGFGIVMAALFGAANAYLGLIAGQTISATFPAAVLAIAAGRLPGLRMNVLEQNLARTSAAVGEALVAGAIFTIPAFVLVSMNGERLWTRFNYWETSIILAVGGLLFVVFTSVTRAGWSVAIRRIPEALMLALPAAGAFLLVALLLALPVYEWMYADGDPLLEHKAAWLNPVGVVARAAIALLVWVGFADVYVRLCAMGIWTDFRII